MTTNSSTDLRNSGSGIEPEPIMQFHRASLLRGRRVY